MRKYLLLIVLICLGVAESPAVRIKDIATISGVRSNQLMGVGLVAGLKGTGDTGSKVTDKALTNLLVNMGVTNRQDLYHSKNIAVVMVTAELPAFVKPGQKIDVFVSSIGDATSLRDGNLLMTPIKGADDQVYAVAQGPIILGGRGAANRSETVCKVVEGAIVEQSVPMEIAGKSSIALNLNKSDFSTATRVAEALDRAGYSGTRAIDPSTVEIPIEAEDREGLVSFIARVQDFMVVPDAVAKVVINQRTGTVVIGENVRLSPVAISHGDVEIHIESGSEGGEEGEGEGLDDALLAMNQATAGGDQAAQQQKEKVIKLVQLREGSTLSSLVKALNSVGTSPQDLIAILQGLKTAGALAAEIEVI
ncbi:flagellar P-ring protein [Candidatus Termititenax aidoneus]|uniref:Flagellar P-ring protein n=1 Tax=Termititenax aidoneus TaxID=2218524 RepID=A0A388T9F6_TERA1|nr:flagellar P-ring protein [Candidatus Termititenax aidoneus]